MNGGCWAEGFKSWIGSRTNWHGFRISSSTVWQSGSRNRENGWLALFRVGNWQNRCGRKSRGLEIWRFRKFTVLTSQRDLHSVLWGGLLAGGLWWLFVPDWSKSVIMCLNVDLILSLRLGSYCALSNERLSLLCWYMFPTCCFLFETRTLFPIIYLWDLLGQSSLSRLPLLHSIIFPLLSSICFLSGKKRGWTLFWSSSRDIFILDIVFFWELSSARW